MPKLSLFFLALCLFCSASNALEPKEREALTLLTLASETNPVQKCVVSALYRNQVLVSAVLKKITDDVIIELLKKSEDSAIAHRLRLAEEWKKTRFPADVATLEFEYCLKRNDPDAPSTGNLERTCFAMTMIPATAEYFKHEKYTKSATLEELRRAFGKEFSEEFLKQVLEAVYSNDTQQSGYKVHRQIFAVCIGKTRVAP